MIDPPASLRTTEICRIIRASPDAIYRACTDAAALVTWRVPDNMTGRMHAFEARQGGSYRMSLTYGAREPSPGGKTSSHTDTFRGRFTELVPGRKIVETVAFESANPAFAGEMKMTTTLAAAAGGTEITVRCERIPAGIGLEDNEAGTRQALQKLAALLEG